jgi:hypothetical protein
MFKGNFECSRGTSNVQLELKIFKLFWDFEEIV